MAHLMIDIETLGTAPNTVILTVAAQSFDPMGTGYFDSSYYARVDFESQSDRSIEDGTLEWWANQNPEAKAEAFAEEGRIALPQVLDELGKLIWKSGVIWANGPTFDMTILENAYKSHNKPLPWQYYKVRDARTVYNLLPDQNSTHPTHQFVIRSGEPHRPASHHALDDCCRQIDLLQATLRQLNVKEVS
jgi:hypothetical protein